MPQLEELIPSHLEFPVLFLSLSGELCSVLCFFLLDQKVLKVPMLRLLFSDTISERCKQWREPLCRACCVLTSAREWNLLLPSG